MKKSINTLSTTYQNLHLFSLRTATARGKAEQSDIASMHAREDAQIAKDCSLEYGVSSPNNEEGDLSKLSLSPNIQPGSSREYTEKLRFET